MALAYTNGSRSIVCVDTHAHEAHYMRNVCYVVIYSHLDTLYTISLVHRCDRTKKENNVIVSHLHEVAEQNERLHKAVKTVHVFCI